MPAAFESSQISRRLPNHLNDKVQACALFTGSPRSGSRVTKRWQRGMPPPSSQVESQPRFTCGHLRSPAFTCFQPLAFTFNRHACNSGSVYPLGCTRPLNTRSLAAWNAADVSKLPAIGR